MRATIAGGVVAGVLALAACSPIDMFTWHSKAGNTTTVTTRAKAGPDDGKGSSFRVDAVCDGEGFWRRGNPVNVNETADANGYFYSRVQCYDNRVPVGVTVKRW